MAPDINSIAQDDTDTAHHPFKETGDFCGRCGETVSWHATTTASEARMTRTAECSECGAGLHPCCGTPREILHDGECVHANRQSPEDRVRRAASSFIRLLDEFGLDPAVLGGALGDIESALGAAPSTTTASEKGQ